MTIRILLLFTICLAITPYQLLSNDSTFNKEKLLLAKVSIRNIDSISESKVFAAFALAAEITGKYQLIPKQIRDSVVNVISIDSLRPTAAIIANKLNAERILFIDINRLNNMLRVDISSVEQNEDTVSAKGKGYSLIHYLSDKDHIPLYDPSLLEATQRAFADLEGDLLMYDTLQNSLKVYPAKTLVIGGIVFINDNELREWELFTRKEVNSFDAIEKIFETARDCPDYVVWDTDSRDAIYSIFNMYGIENANAATTYELQALEKFDVDRYITGTLKRTKFGAEIELFMCEIIGANLKILNSVKGSIQKDELEEFRKEITRLTEKLLK